MVVDWLEQLGYGSRFIPVFEFVRSFTALCSLWLVFDWFGQFVLCLFLTCFVESCMLLVLLNFFVFGIPLMDLTECVVLDLTGH